MKPVEITPADWAAANEMARSQGLTVATLALAVARERARWLPEVRPLRSDVSRNFLRGVITDADRSDAIAMLARVFLWAPELFREHPAAIEGVAQSITDARFWENKACEIVALGDSCGINDGCNHASCKAAHALAARIAGRRAG